LLNLNIKTRFILDKVVALVARNLRGALLNLNIKTRFILDKVVALVVRNLRGALLLLKGTLNETNI